MMELQVGKWVRLGPLRDRDGLYIANRRIGKVQALCQGGMRAIVRLHHGCPVTNPNTWMGEEMVDSSMCEIICKPEWDDD